MYDVIKGFQPRCDVMPGLLTDDFDSFRPSPVILFRHPPGMLTYFHYFAAALLTFDSPFLSAAAGMLTSLPYSLFSDPHYTYREGNWPNLLRTANWVPQLNQTRGGTRETFCRGHSGFLYRCKKVSID